MESGECGGIWWVWWDLVGVVGSGGIWRVLVYLLCIIMHNFGNFFVFFSSSHYTAIFEFGCGHHEQLLIVTECGRGNGGGGEGSGPGDGEGIFSFSHLTNTGRLISWNRAWFSI